MLRRWEFSSWALDRSFGAPAKGKLILRCEDDFFRSNHIRNIFAVQGYTGLITHNSRVCEDRTPTHWLFLNSKSGLVTVYDCKRKKKSSLASSANIPDLKQSDFIFSGVFISQFPGTIGRI
jgi:hypothetical protein